jgi:hypothetical protein
MSTYTQASSRWMFASQSRKAQMEQMSSGPPVVQFSIRCRVKFRFVGPNGTMLLRTDKLSVHMIIVWY